MNAYFNSFDSHYKQDIYSCVSGFTLDKESHTLGLVCKDVTLVVAFDTRERLLQWRVKMESTLGQG